MIVAVDVLPRPPLVAEMVTEFVVEPLVVPSIPTVMVQLVLGARLPPLHVIEVLPAMAVSVPLQVPPTVLGFPTTSPAVPPVKLSVNASPFNVTVLVAGLTIVKVSVDAF